MKRKIGNSLRVCTTEIKHEEKKVEEMERQSLASRWMDSEMCSAVISENLKSMRTEKSLREGHINLLNQLLITSLFSTNRGLI